MARPSPTARPANPGIRRLVLAVLVAVLVAVLAAHAVVLAGRRAQAPSTSSAGAAPAPLSAAPPLLAVPHPPSAGPGGGHRGRLGAADGVVPDGVTVFDDVPAVARLEPDLRQALRRAAAEAGHDGVRFVVTSGWRSRAYQDQLLRDAVARYGSEAAAARWVATAATSPHVSGDAVDLGPAGTISWLSAHGAAYGLCQIYRNEPWHYELRPRAADRGCPPMYANPTEDPRMHQ